MLPMRPSSNLYLNQSIFTSDQADLDAADSSGDEALAPYTLLSDEQDTPPNTPGYITSAEALNSTLGNVRPTKPLGNNFQNILEQPTGNINEDSEITSAVKMNTQFADINERAATARQMLRNISWSGGEDFFRPAQLSSCTATVASPKSPLPRRATPSIPASPVCSSGPSSSTDRDHVQSVLQSHKSATEIELTATSTQSKEDLNSSHPELSLSSDLSSLPSSPPPPLDENCERVSRVKRLKNLVPPLATQPDEMGQYESSSCHQCRNKTTRPKMICDQSHNPNCVIRVCRNCLLNRAVYDNIQELRPPIFQFVPGGRMLCVKCRGICPCAHCRRKRGEKEEDRRGLKGFYGLTPEDKEKALLKKKRNQEKTKLKKASRPRQDLVNSVVSVDDQASEVPSVSLKRRKQLKEAWSDDIICLDQAPATSAGKPGQAKTVCRPILPAEGSRVTAQINRQSNKRPIASQADHTTLRQRIDGNSAEPKRGGACPRKGKSCARQPGQTHPSIKPEKDSNLDEDNTLNNRPLQPNNRSTKSATGPASFLQNKENAPELKKPECARLERSDKQLKLKIREIELKNAADEAERLRIKAQGFEKAKMLQELLKSGLSYKEAMEATLTFLGPSA